MLSAGSNGHVVDVTRSVGEGGLKRTEVQVLGLRFFYEILLGDDVN